MTAPVEPVDLRLRGDPPRVTRLSRKALGLLAATATLGIGGALIYALQPSAPAEQVELYATDASPIDGLAGAPKDYSQVPKLGPPLPGDLGKPILSAQERSGGQQLEAVQPTPAQGTGADPAQAERQRRQQERDAARTSKLFLGDGTRGGAAVPQAAPALLSEPAVPGSPTGTGDQGAKRAFLSSDRRRPTESAGRLASPGSPFVLQAGSIIPAALISGIRSDLPGQITAQVTQHIYDSPSGRHLLIPQGSRLIGEYDSQVSFGQNRVLLAWDRLILPDGRYIDLDRLPGADPAGFAGLQDRTDNHWGGMFRAALVSTLLAVGTEIGSSAEDELVQALRRGSADTLVRTGQDLVRRQMNVQPTLTIRPGSPLRLVVTRDLVLTPILGRAR